jgi:predicted dienelactone hydrolase
MKTLKSRLLSTAAAVSLALVSTCSFAAGFQHGFADDPDGKPLEIGIWYPSKETPKPMNFGPNTMAVAVNGAVDGTALPLVVVSHGAGSSFMGHYDTAIALADAGYVVAAVTHTGDNYADKTRSVDIMDRPRHISRVIDHMLSAWEGHGNIDAARVGMFGYSAGGFTTLVSIGGVADFSTIGPMCSQYPADFACQLIAKSGRPTVLFPASSFKADLRIKAALVAAPALGFSFAPDGLKSVKVPVQLWSAENDVMVPTPRYAEAVRLALPQAPDYRVVHKAGHYDFMAPCGNVLAGLAPSICKIDADFDRVAFHATFNAAAVDFFGKTLKAL